MFFCCYFLQFLICINYLCNCDKSAASVNSSQKAQADGKYKGESKAQKSVQRSKDGSDETYQFPQTLSKITADFSLKLLKLLKSDGKFDDNLLISPASIVTLSAMLYDGSDKNTRKQINDVVFNGFNEDQINKFVKNFTESVKILNEAYGVTLTSANKVYCSINGKPKDNFIKLIKENFYALFDSVNFQTDAENVRNLINNWVSRETKNKITELFKSGTITPDTSMALVNAILFQGVWTYQFDSSNTIRSKFYINDRNESVIVQIMNQTNTNFLYHRNKQAKILGLPYGNEQFVMYIILPTKRFGLEELEKNLDDKTLLTLISQAQNRGYITTGMQSPTFKTDLCLLSEEAFVYLMKAINSCCRGNFSKVTLPKFKMDKPYDLTKIFTSLGMTDMFNQEVADFSKIDGDKHQFVSAAMHRAFIEINEQGTKAGAASGAGMEWRTLPEKVIFEVNEPFIFLVSDTQTGNILFFGRVSSL